MDHSALLHSSAFKPPQNHSFWRFHYNVNKIFLEWFQSLSVTSVIIHTLLESRTRKVIQKLVSILNIVSIPVSSKVFVMKIEIGIKCNIFRPWMFDPIFCFKECINLKHPNTFTHSNIWLHTMQVHQIHFTCHPKQ